jgi:hypothetical protein
MIKECKVLPRNDSAHDEATKMPSPETRTHFGILKDRRHRSSAVQRLTWRFADDEHILVERHHGRGGGNNMAAKSTLDLVNECDK